MSNSNNILQDQNTQASADQSDICAAADASYIVEYGEDGVFVKVCYETDDGLPLSPAVVSYDLCRRNITGADIGRAILGVRRREERIRIANAQPEPPSDTTVYVSISQDEMSAGMVLLPPCGTGADKTPEELLLDVQNKWGVIFGVDEDAIKTAVQDKRYYQEIHIAAGKSAEQGKDGKAVLLFNTQHSYAPKIAADGTADYKNLNVFEGVRVGAPLAVLEAPGEGTEGCNVKGRIIPARKGQDVKLPKGKNVFASKDGLSLIAAKNGRVDYINGQIVVSDVFRIAGDVDMGTGNIKFDGDVIVMGNVISGLTVEATGTVEVGGYVEAANIIAGKDIILRNGMQGMGKGMLKAKESIVARFLEHCTLEAKKDIISDSIVHCDATAGEAVKMQGKWARILGGVIRASRSITANTVGTLSNELTEIELGTSAEIRSRYTKLTTEKDELKAQLDKVVMMLRVIPANSVSPEHQQLLPKLSAAKEQLQRQYTAALSSLEALTAQIEELSHAQLHVLKAIYPNVKISINMCSMTTRSLQEKVSFHCRTGGIVSSYCEIKQ